MNDIVKTNIQEKLLKALLKDPMPIKEVGAILGINPPYVSMIKNPATVKRAPFAALESVLLWVNSGQSLREYSKKYGRVLSEKDESKNDAVFPYSDNCSKSQANVLFKLVYNEEQGLLWVGNITDNENIIGWITISESCTGKVCDEFAGLAFRTYPSLFSKACNKQKIKGDFPPWQVIKKDFNYFLNKERNEYCGSGMASLIDKTEAEKEIENNHLFKNFQAVKEVKEKPQKTIPPTIEQVKAYCEERKNNVNPAKFMAHYEAVGWLVGKAKMKDWRASVRYWENNNTSSYIAKQEITRETVIKNLSLLTNQDLIDEFKKRGGSGEINFNQKLKF